MSERDKLISKWVRPAIRDLAAYHVPGAEGLIKLDAMENPYAWPREMADAWLDELRMVSLNRYPDPAAQALKLQLQTSMQVPDGHGLLLGNGSDELIQMILMAVSAPDRVVMAPEPGFVMYRMIASFLDLNYVGVPLREDFSLDGEAMLDAIASHQPAVIFLAYPNNPTGNLFDDKIIEAVIRASDGLVVIDEAYHAFAGQTWMQRMAQYDNVLVMRTVSKMGLAGLRLGLLAGHPDWLAQIDKLRLPYNINVLTQVSARFALQHQAVLDAQTATITRDRETLFSELQRIGQITAFPSQANFILFRVPAGKANEIFLSLKQQGILIKNMGQVRGPLRDCLRVTVGAAEENTAFLDALRFAIGQLTGNVE